jgi:hypothetical protein
MNKKSTKQAPIAGFKFKAFNAEVENIFAEDNIDLAIVAEALND